MIFKLDIDTFRPNEPRYDATIIPTENSNKLRYYFSNPNLYGIEILPSRIFFQANLEIIKRYNFPFTDSGLFIVNDTVLEILSQFDEQSYFSSVPVTMIDEKFKGEIFNDKGELNEKVTYESNYFAIRFSNLLNCFDRKNSVYRPLRSDPNILGKVKKIVLEKPENGFPPAFRVDVFSSNIFVSEKIKNALEYADLIECNFEKVGVSSDDIS